MKVRKTIKIKNNSGEWTVTKSDNGTISAAQNTSASTTNFSRILFALVSIFGFIVLPVLSALYLDRALGLSSFVENNLVFSFIIIGLYSLVFLWFITYMGQWAAISRAAPGIQPLEKKELVTTLNNLKLTMPVSIENIDENKIKISWNYANEKFKHLLGAGKINATYEILLSLNVNSHKVFASETTRKLSMTAGGVLNPGARFNFSFFKGISLANFDYSKGYGFNIKDNKLVFDKLYEYEFNQRELKSAVVSIINYSGWDYCPKIFLF